MENVNFTEVRRHKSSLGWMKKLEFVGLSMKKR